MIDAQDTDDKMHEECGVFGIQAIDSAAPIAALGLHALQHRGQEAAGIVSFDGANFHAHHALGHVGANFSRGSAVEKLVGNRALGHVRYATTGETSLRNVQPLFADFDFGGFAISHNGNLTNAYLLRRDLVKKGCLFQATSDTAVIIHLIALSQAATPVDRLIDALRQVQGAYSLVCLSETSLIGVRDPNGVRPLVLGKLGDAYVMASETSSFDIIGATFLRDIEPGEMVVVTAGQLTSLRPFEPAPHRFCIFEYVYFARPDSVLDGLSVYEARKNIGIELAKEAAIEADIVVPVPDGGVPAAIGYAEQSGLPFDLAITRSHYIGRTFIEPTQNIRHLGVKLKLNPNRKFIDGKRVVLIDDSIVRGTTSVKIVEMLRQAGAKEVHIRVASPPTKFGCFYGIDTAHRQSLLAHQYDLDGMTKFIGADSLAFVSIDGLYKAMNQAGRNNAAPQYCDACFTGDYPVPLLDQTSQADTDKLSSLKRSS